MNASALLRLLQLSSPSLPIGAYAYSQGVESAVHGNIICDENSALEWLNSVLMHGLASNDLALISHAYGSWQACNFESIKSLSQLSLAIRETAELKEEDRHLAKALLRLGAPLGLEYPADLKANASYPIVYAYFVQSWQVPLQDALLAFAWSWLENQIAAMIKLVPLGQTQGQTLLLAMDESLSAAVEKSGGVPVNRIGNSLAHLAILSSQHENQYSRLFRS
ncbi:MAG: urease accessory protein UreF [Thiotrichales bacterium]|nr:urease accessory protein UreF [Thiotrichales bacterium]